MARSPGRAGVVGRWLRETVPADLAAVLVLVALVDVAALAPVVRDTPLRVVLGLPMVLFLPGYALVAALFPERGEPTDEDAGTRREGIDGIERVALSFGTSIAVTPLLGLALNFTPWGIRLVPILVVLSAFTVGATLVAVRRRLDLPAEERFRVPYREWTAAARSELLEPADRVDLALNLLLVASVLLAAGSVTYAVAVPKQGEQFTEFYLLTRADDGSLVAADYPTEFVRGEGRPLVVGVGNQEHVAVSYTVVVELQRVAFEGNESTVTGADELDRFRLRLDHNETRHVDYTVVPTTTGTRLRLAFLLYRDAPPPSPTVENAYRETHLWVNVTETGG